MPELRLKVSNFPANSGLPNGAQSWDLSWPKLVWAAVSVGKSSLAHMAQHGTYSMFEIAYRAAMVYANLLQSANGRFGRSAAYDGLDPSEKGAISYFLGVALTKAFVADKLEVPWLMHIDLFRDRFAINLAPGERPDLFGQDSLGRWVVAESKGRTNSHDSDALIKAKRQASQVIDIGGLMPHISIGLVASFGKDGLSLVADDPPIDVSDGRVRLNVSTEEFRETYYRPFVRLVESRPSRRVVVEGVDVQAVRSESVDLMIGVSEHRLAEIRGRRRVESNVGVLAAPSSDGSAFLGADGIYVELGPSWEETRMRLQPQER